MLSGYREPGLQDKYMSVKTFLSFALNAVAAVRLRRRGLSLSVGNDSKALLWRISPNRGSKLEIGDKCLVSTNIVFERPDAEVRIGDRTFIGGKGVFSVASRITIGCDVMLSWGCTIADHDSHSLVFAERATDVIDYIEGKKDWTKVPVSSVHIGDKVWMGFNCSVLKGVTIGEGAVIAANSNVTKDVAPWTLVAGNPARVIRELPRE